MNKCVRHQDSLYVFIDPCDFHPPPPPLPENKRTFPSLTTVQTIVLVEAKNNVGQTKMSATVTVRERTEAPKITQSPKSQNIKEGELLKVSAKITGINSLPTSHHIYDVSDIRHKIELCFSSETIFSPFLNKYV